MGTFLNPDPSPLDYGYAQFSPSTGLIWRPSSGFSLHFRYRKGITRPGLDKLNPYLDNSDPLNLRTGNPHLHSENMHTFTLSPRPEKRLCGVLFDPEVRYTLITGAIEQVTTVSEEGVGLTTYLNLGRRSSWDIGFSASSRIKWVSLRVSPSYQQIIYTSSNDDVGINTVRNLSLALDMNITPWRGGSISCSYKLQPGIATAQSTKVHYYNNFRFYWQQAIVKNKFFATLSLDNPFESHRYISNTISGAGFTYTDRREQLGRVWSLTLRANFGRFEEKVSTQSNILQDRER